MTVPYKPTLVSSQRIAIDLSIDSWKTPKESWIEMLDAYQYREIIFKRDGYQWFDSVPHVLPLSGAMTYQNITGITNGPNSLVTLSANHGLSDGDIVRLTDVLGLTSPPTDPPINGTRWTVTVTGHAANVFAINNSFAFIGTFTAGHGTASQMPFPGTSYTGTPVVAIASWVDTTGMAHLMVLDTKRASIFDTNVINSCLVPIGYTDQFTGMPFNLFWWENYFGYIFFTNNVDNIFYYNGTTQSTGLVAFAPIYDRPGTDTVQKCLMIKAIGQRLCLYNTQEANVRYAARVRWCQALVDPTKTPSDTPPQDPWNQLIPGKGGFFDLTDSQYIISMGQLQNNNLIFSQNQTVGQPYGVVYEQRIINDPKYAYAFIKVGTSRNVNSTFGTIVLDRQITAVGNQGLVNTDGNSIGRYDERIPDFAAEYIDQAGFANCFGIRNDARWQAWIAYTPNGQTQNTQIAVFNYQDQSWQFYRIGMNCLGLFPFPRSDPAWNSYGTTLPDYTWMNFTDDETWADIIQAQTTMVLGGDFNGNIWWMDQGGGDASANVVYGEPPDNGLPITMELTSRRWSPATEIGMATRLGYIDFLLTGDPTTLATVTFNVDYQTTNYQKSFLNTIPFEDIALAEISGATKNLPCVITAVDHELVTGQIIYIFGVQGMIQLNGGIYTITVINKDTFELNGVDSSLFGTYTGGGIVTSQAITQNIFWTRLWSGQQGMFHQIKIAASGVNETFALHALIYWFRATGRIYK